MGRKNKITKMDFISTGVKVGPPRPNMPLIREFMKEAGLRGNPNKYVILSSKVPPTIISRDKRYVIKGVDWGILKLPILIHKRELKNYISDEHAKMFWCNDCVTQR